MDNNNHRQGLEIEESDDDEEIAVGNDIYLPKKAKLTHQEEEEEISSFSIDDEEGGEEGEEEEENKNLVAEDENPYSSSVLAFLRTAPNLTHNNKNGGGSSPASTTTASNLLQSSDASTSDSPPLSSILQSAFAAAVASGSATGKYSCLLCTKKFDSSKMLQQHNQSFHTDKQFVCEICGKAFRFRSNLAEHRSVHTAIKPFVCRFCGKSSRLKGNLTKHILKHHKKEQNDYIGTDDIIIKKGKKSVKDPAAIDFLEKSMIVLNGGNVGGGSGNASGTTSNPSAGSRSGRAASVNESLSGSSTPMGILNAAPSVEEQQRCFLMSLGLEPGSIDLKAESPDSDSSIGSQARTTNDQLLEKCNAYAAKDVDLNGSGGSHHNNEDGGGGRHSALTEDFLSHFTSAAAGGSGGGGGSSGASNVNAAVAATLANLVANNNNSIHHRNNGSSTKLDDSSRISEAVSRIASSMQTPQSSISGTSKKTQCPECGKHMRKPKDLVTHLTTIHRYSPDDIANVTGNLNLMTSTSESPIIIPSSLSTTLNTTTSSSSGGGGGADTSGISDYGRSALTTELKQIQKTLNELKSQRNVPHLTQAVNNLDTRIGRMEKQLEMVLNTLYTLVQLQTGNLTKSK